MQKNLSSHTLSPLRFIVSVRYVAILVAKVLSAAFLMVMVMYSFVTASIGSHEADVSADTLALETHLLTDNLKKAHSIEYRYPEELMVTESDADRISVLQVSLDDRETINHEYIELSELDRPGAVASLAQTYVAVVNNGSEEVVLLDDALGYLRLLQVPGWVLDDKTFQPSDITSNIIGESYVLDSAGKSVYHFDANGSYLQYLSLEHMDRPVSLMYAEESLFVSDGGSGKVYVLTGSGHELASIGVFPNLHRVRVIDRTIWILSGGVIHAFNIYGEHIGNWKLPDPDKKIVDLLVMDNHLFLLTACCLYFSSNII